MTTTNGAKRVERTATCGCTYVRYEGEAVCGHCGISMSIGAHQFCTHSMLPVSDPLSGMHRFYCPNR